MSRRDLTRALVLDAANAMGRTVVPARDGSEIDLAAPWDEVAILDLVSTAVGPPVRVDISV